MLWANFDIIFIFSNWNKTPKERKGWHQNKDTNFILYIFFALLNSSDSQWLKIRWTSQGHNDRQNFKKWNEHQVQRVKREGHSVGWPESRLMYNSSCWLFPAQFGEVRCSSKQRLGCFVIRIICTRNGPNSLSSTSHLSWSINSIAFIGNCFQSPCHYHNLSEFLHEIINGKTVIFLVQDRCDSSLTIVTIIFQV